MSKLLAVRNTGTTRFDEEHPVRITTSNKQSFGMTVVEAAALFDSLDLVLHGKEGDNVPHYLTQPR